MSRRAMALGALFFLLVTVLWYFFLLSPRNARISELDGDLQAAVSEEDSLRAAAAALRDVQENDVAFLAAIGEMEAGIPEEAELAVFIEEVTALAESTGIDVQSIAPSEPAVSASLPVYEITVTMALEGEYFELLGFLFGLDDMERIVVVQGVAITAGGGGDAPLPEETTTTIAGETTTSGVSTTTTTIPTLSENPLSVSLTVKLYTRSPLLPAVAVVDDAATQDGTTEGDASGGTVDQGDAGEAPSNQAAGGSTP